MSARDGEAGFTLVEVLVALALFAVIGAAGLAVLDQVLRVQRLTEGRLDRLAEIQRAMHVIGLDALHARAGSLAHEEGALAFGRTGGTPDLAVDYRLEEGALLRGLSDDDGGGGGGDGGGEEGVGGRGGAVQILMHNVEAAAWRFWRADTGWIDAWPPPDPAAAPGNPAAIELSLTLAPPGPAGLLRRVAPLPTDAP